MPTVVALTGHPCAARSAAQFRGALDVHRSGDIGSPRVSGSTRTSNASVIPWLRVLDAGAPRPGLADASGRHALRQFGAASRIVWRASPVADETIASPPKPIAIYSADNRRVRSLSSGPITTYLATSVVSRSYCAAPYTG